MTKPDFTLHWKRLLALRARFQGDMTQMEDNALNKDHNKTTSMPNHMAELGSGNFDQDLTLSMLGNEQDALDQIEAAIERIEDGSYGQCEGCGMKIPEPRLEAIPYAALCVRCASQQEEGHRDLTGRSERLSWPQRASRRFILLSRPDAHALQHPTVLVVELDKVLGDQPDDFNLIEQKPPTGAVSVLN